MFDLVAMIRSKSSLKSCDTLEPYQEYEMIVGVYMRAVTQKGSAAAYRS